MKLLYAAAALLTLSSPVAAQVSINDLELITDSIVASPTMTIPTRSFELASYERTPEGTFYEIGELIGVCANATERIDPPQNGLIQRGFVACKDRDRNFEGFGVSLKYADGTLLLIDDFNPTDTEVDYCTLVTRGKTYVQEPETCRSEFDMAILQKLGKRLIT